VSKKNKTSHFQSILELSLTIGKVAYKQKDLIVILFCQNIKTKYK